MADYPGSKSKKKRRSKKSGSRRRNEEFDEYDTLADDNADGELANKNYLAFLQKQSERKRGAYKSKL